ncbi:DUF4920 domain-containing protein [Mongoliitalea daihaiensis]|uniref:DUF4920 domain-containing protein n=1 Tax=Mongoliitalea daihaiensis TaxID=2782006 RepID=UPI001F47F57F|nr:DUF4920 domain-containing protein [Mongoliitalea daihaiensis]UJP63550.1 DUF4920 domain-containing protein [Mongoliitalea daihaiensis]
MKKLLSILLGLSLLACQSETKTVEEEGKEELPVGMFGDKISESGALTLESLVTTLEDSGEFEGKVIGEIKDVCSMKGCWMTIDLPNGETMRVTFKDYGFFVPKNAHGYPVIIEGVASKKFTDVATLKHYAEDAGKSQEEIDAITNPKVEYAFEAVGVIIQENA